MKHLLLTFLFLGSIAGVSMIPSQAEALKVNFEPSVTFRNSYSTGYHRPARVVRQQYNEVYLYHDPYTNTDYYHYYPVVQDVVEYYPPYRSHYRTQGTDFNFKLKFK